MTDTLTQEQRRPAAAGSPGPARAPQAGRPRARGRRWAIAGAAALVVAGVGLWYWTGRTGPKASYSTAPVEVGAVARSVTASGTVNPVLTIVVGSYVSGVIQDIACDYNTQVRKGQVCARIDPRPYELQVEQDRAALGTARAQLVKDQANLTYQQLNAERYARLFAQDSTSRDLADNARNLRDQAAAQVAYDRASIAQREAALHGSEVDLGYTRITSPVDGTVVSRNVTIGQTVAASFQTPTLFLIAQDLTKMQVDTNVSESDIGGNGRGVAAGDPATFTVEAFPNRVFRGVVAQVRQSPQTVQNVVTYDVVVAVDNPRLELKPGMTATVKIVTAQRQGVLRVPNQALRFTPGGLGGASQAGPGPSRVWLLKDGKPSPVAVRTGLSDDSYTELTGGELRAGQRVITAQTGGGARKSARTGAPLPRL